MPGVVMPAPTAWPFAMALGSALTFTGLLTDVSVSVLGGILTICGAVGWFRQVLPHEHHEVFPVGRRAAARGCRQRGRAIGIGRRDPSRMVAAEDLPHLCRREGRTGRRRGDGHLSGDLRTRLSSQHLVSHQPAGWKPVRTLVDANR